MSRRRPRTRRVIESPAGLDRVPCPGCGCQAVEHPGYVEWAARWLRVAGELPPPEPRDVPSWAWWWCPACDDAGMHAPADLVWVGPGGTCPHC